MFLKIALRNVFRNKRRTALSMAVIVFGVSMLYLVVGFVHSSLASTKESMAQTFGSVQIADARVFEGTTRGYDHLLDADTLAVINGLLADDPRVLGTKAELGFTGLIGNSKGSRLVTGAGFVPGNPVEDFSGYVVEGEPLGAVEPDPEDRFAGREVILGRKLAAALDVAPGDLINVATTSTTGNFSAASARITGVFKYNDQEKEGQLAYVSLPFAQKLMRTERVERIVVDLETIDAAEGFAAELEGKLAAAGLAGLGVEPWQALNPLYDQVKQFGDAFTLFTNAGVFILVFFGVLEVLTMSFLERTREVGTIRAVGTKRRQVFAMFLQEGLALGVLGSLLGVAAGAGAALWVNGSGLSWLPPGAIDPVPVSVQIGLGAAALPLAAALLSTLLGAIYPAFKGSRLNIVRALGYV